MRYRLAGTSLGRSAEEEVIGPGNDSFGERVFPEEFQLEEFDGSNAVTWLRGEGVSTLGAERFEGVGSLLVGLGLAVERRWFARVHNNCAIWIR